MGRVIQLLLLNFTIISTLDASLGIILFTRRLTLDKPTFCKRHVVAVSVPLRTENHRVALQKVKSSESEKKEKKEKPGVVFPRKSH